MERGRCPICGESNSCGMLAGKNHEDCWCAKAKFEKEMFDFVPQEYSGISCICPKCIGEFHQKKEFKKVYDLHLHTTASDGTVTPKELVKLSKEMGLKGIAITDHDTTDGIAEGITAAKEFGIELIPGIELSSSLNGNDVHILGYFINKEDPFLIEILQKINIKRDERNLRILKNLEKYKIKLTLNELKQEAKGKIISKLHIANVMVNKGIVYTKEEAFKSYLGKNGVVYEGHGSFSPHRAVEILVQNGAFVSLAHPNVYSKNINEVEKLLIELKEKGLKGIEAQYPTFSKEEKKQYLELAKKHNLLVTGGSDFHGSNKKHINLGVEGVSFSQMLLIKESLKNKKE